jgi:hypothetical protein
VVEIQVQWIKLPNGAEKMILFTGDEEDAMLMRAAYLPGQMAGIQAETSLAFSRGVMHAIASLSSWGRS